MKRQLSLVLALVMILGTFTTVFAADTNPVDAVKVASDFLVKNEVLVGDADGNLMLDENLSRQDTVVLVSKLMGEFDVAAEFPTAEGIPTYEDIADNFYLPLLAWAQANETFVGHSDAKFGFGDNLTAQEYAKVLLVALDYTVSPNGDADVKWDDALAKAKDLGILADVDVKDADELLRGQMAVMTFNALGVAMNGSDKTLAEKLGIEMPAAAKPEVLEAKVLDTENLAEVVVELSNVDLVKSKDALLNPANYRLNNDAKVEHVHLDGDNVVLTLVPYGKLENQGKFDTLVKGKKFELTIRNVDTKINKTYKGIMAGDNSIPVVENVEFMGDYGIKVTTSEPIANPLERNFRLDSRTAMVVEQYGRDIVLTPYHGKAFDKDAVELTIDQLNDFAGYTSVKSVEEMAISTDEGLPVVDKAYRTGNKLVVEFDRDVYHDSIAKYENRRSLGNVSFTERRVDFYAEKAEKVDTNVVEYTFSRDIPKGMEIAIEGVANHFNKAMEKDLIVPAEFRDDFAPVVISSTENLSITQASDDDLKAAYVGKTDAEKKAILDAGFTANTKEMTIIFDKDIEEFKTLKASDIDVEDHFTLYELDITRRGKDAANAAPNKVDVKVAKVEKDRIKLTFENIKVNNKDKDFDYILEVRNFSDTNRNRMEREYLDFQVVRVGIDFNVEVKDIKATRYFNRDGIEITLEFNDYVNKEEASNANNYYLTEKATSVSKLAVDEAIVERDGETVSLIVYDIDTVDKFLAKYSVLEISPRVKDLSSPAQSTANRFFNLKTRESADPAAPVETSAITYKDGAIEIKEDILVLDIATGPKALTVNFVADETDKAQIANYVTYKKDGSIDAVNTGALTINPGTAKDVAKVGNLSLVTTAREEYTIETTFNGEVTRLVVRVVDTDLDAKIVYKADNTIKEDNVTDNTTTLVLPYGTDVNALSVDAFTIEGSTTATVTETSKTADTIFITVEAENGAKDIYKVTLDVQVITAAVTTAPAAGSTITVTVTDQQTAPKAIKGIEAAKFSVKSGPAGTLVANAVTNVVDNGDGTYTLTLTTPLISTHVVETTVGTVLAPITIAVP